MKIILKFLVFLVFLYWYKDTKNKSVLLIGVFSLIEALRAVMGDKLLNTNLILAINVVEALLLLGALIFFIVSLKKNNKFK